MSTASLGLASAQTVAPKLTLNFATASLDPRITFTRATSASNPATFVNSSGVLTSATNNQPRFDYDPSTLVCKGLLIEESRTNFVSGVNFVNPTSTTGWTLFGEAAATLSVVTDTTELTAAGLSGICTSGSVYKVDNSAGVNSAYARVDAGFTMGTSNCTFSAYARGSGTFQFDVNVGSWTGSITKTLTSTYTRQSVTGASNTSSNQFRVRVFPGSVMYFILVQGEVGSFSTSVIPLTGTALTRNADVAVMTGTNFSDWFNASKGTFRVDAFSPAVDTRCLLSVDDNTANNSQVVITDATAPKFIVKQGGAEQANVAAGTVVANAAMFAYVSYDTNYFGIARPTARQVDTSGTIPTVDRLRIGVDQAGNYANGQIQAIRFWP